MFVIVTQRVVEQRGSTDSHCPLIATCGANFPGEEAPERPAPVVNAFGGKSNQAASEFTPDEVHQEPQPVQHAQPEDDDKGDRAELFEDTTARQDVEGPDEDEGEEEDDDSNRPEPVSYEHQARVRHDHRHSVDIDVSDPNSVLPPATAYPDDIVTKTPAVSTGTHMIMMGPLGAPPKVAAVPPAIAPASSISSNENSGCSYAWETTTIAAARAVADSPSRYCSS